MGIGWFGRELGALSDDGMAWHVWNELIPYTGELEKGRMGGKWIGGRGSWTMYVYL